MSIRIENLNHIYGRGTPFEKLALENISLEIQSGDFVGLIGHTGSGKSTLVQHINGLLKPSSGNIVVDGVDIREKGVDMKSVRQKVGLVFQYPEHQLFEETIYKDIAFGPKNLDLSEAEVDERVREAMDMVDLDFEEYRNRSPFELSGGQKRRVAIAGVLAMKPTTLILDEPTAGLDPRGRDELLSQLKRLNTMEDRMTIILVSHSMDDIAELVDNIVLMNRGKIGMVGRPSEIFKRVDEVESFGLSAPQVTYLMKALKVKYPDIDDEIYRIEDAKQEILRYLGEV